MAIPLKKKGKAATTAKPATKSKIKPPTKPGAKTEVAKKVPVVKSKGLTDIQSAMLGIYSDIAEKIENEIHILSDDNDAGFYMPYLVPSVLIGKITSAMYVVSGAEQSSKCVRGDTLVNTKDGFLHMDELGLKNGLNKYSNMIVTEKGLKKVTHSYVGKHTTVRLKTNMGRTIEGTKNHPMLVFNQQLRYEWKNLEDISIGDWLVGVKNPKPVFGDNPVTKAQATLLGYMVANGSSNLLSSYDQNVLDRFDAALVQEIGQPSRKVKDGGRFPGKRGCGNNYFHKIFRSLGYYAKRAREKEIPFSIRQAPREILHEFLESYFECDSGYCGSNVRLISASEVLIDQLHSILYMVYGIRGNKKRTQNWARNSRNPKMRPYYELLISGKDALTFFDCFERAKVQKHAHRFVGDRHQGYNKNIPHVRKYMQELYEDCRVGTDSRDSRMYSHDGEILRNVKMPKFANVSDSGRSDNPHATEMLFKDTDWGTVVPVLEKMSPKTGKLIKQMLELDYDYEEVVSKKYSKKLTKVYDVTVPETESFIANGLISHNSSLLAAMMGASLKNNTLLNKHADAENAMRSTYMGGIIEQACGIPWSELRGSEDAKGRVTAHSRYRWHTNSSLDDIFNDFVSFLESLPHKVYDASLKEWFLVYDPASVSREHKDSLARMSNVLPKHKKSTKDRIWFSVGQDDSLQAVLAIDSIKAMTLRKKESGLRMTDQPAKLAKELAQTLPYLKGSLREKHVALMCINQMYENPLSMQNRKPAEYETAGNAVKFNSDMRCIMKKCAVQDPFEKSKESSGQSKEPSVLHDGFDYYEYKSITNIKNKMSAPGLKSHIRMWVRGKKQTPGIDPVYDVAKFYEMIGLAKLGRKGQQPILNFSDDGAFYYDTSDQEDDIRLESMPWQDFKLMVLAERYPENEYLQEQMSERGIPQLELIRIGFEMLKSGEALDMISGTLADGVALIDHTANDDGEYMDNESEDDE